jgi:hypothetical protein
MFEGLSYGLQGALLRVEDLEFRILGVGVAARVL